MRSLIGRLNPVFDSRIRLGIMAALAVRDAVDFTALRTLLDLTDGNLASHMAVLEKHRYVRVRKGFIGKKPLTTYQLTETGRKVFADHLGVLEEVIRGTT